MSNFEALLNHVRQNDEQRQAYLNRCRDTLNAVMIDITNAVKSGGGNLEAHREGNGEETVQGALRMQVQVDLPAPLTFDLHTTHIHTWVGVRPLNEGYFEFSMPELPHPVRLSSHAEAVPPFFIALMAGDDWKLAEFKGK